MTHNRTYLHEKVTPCSRLGNKSKIQVFLPAQKRYTMRYVREKLYIVMTYNPTYLHHYIVTEMLFMAEGRWHSSLWSHTAQFI